jgi:hypothetical protein
VRRAELRAPHGLARDETEGRAARRARRGIDVHLDEAPEAERHLQPLRLDRRERVPRAEDLQGRDRGRVAGRDAREARRDRGEPREQRDRAEEEPRTE